MATVKSTAAISFMAVALLIIRLSLAVNHTVGSPGGSWDTSTDLNSWASSRTFVVGDNLVFQYTSNHVVTEVPKPDYDLCQAANPIGTYTRSSTVISLASPGKRYFICTTPGHCSQGMKLEIDTVAASPTPPPSSPATPPPQSPVVPSPPESPAIPPPETDTAATPPQAPSSPKSSPPASAPPPPVAEPPKSSANKITFYAAAALVLCTGFMTFLAF